jgi:hypothetical protein
MEQPATLLDYIQFWLTAYRNNLSFQRLGISMRLFDRVVAWLAGDHVPPAVALMQREFPRTCRLSSLILQEALSDSGDTGWTQGRVWLASATHAYCIYALWNQRSNKGSTVFQQALDTRIEHVACDIATLDHVDALQLANAARLSYPLIQYAFDAKSSDDPFVTIEFPFVLLHHLLKMVIGESASGSQAFATDVATSLMDVMSETFAALSPYER